MSEALITIGLTRNQWGQILDGLQIRHQDWQGTADVVDEEGNPPDYFNQDEEDFTLQECSSQVEAQSIADDYAEIIDTIIMRLPDEH